jgi:hypothetical protein
VIVSLIDFAVGSSVLIALMIYYRVPPTAAMAALPVVLFVHIIFTISISLLLAMANLFYRDVKYLFEIVITIWMFLSAVLYPGQSGHRTGGQNHGRQSHDSDSRGIPRRVDSRPLPGSCMVLDDGCHIDRDAGHRLGRLPPR